MSSMKETIKAKAIGLFFQKGYFATSISEIAKASGIRKASIYYHFSGKEDLLFHIMQTTMTDLMADFETNLAQAYGVEDQMRAAVRSHVLFHLQRQKETFIASSELRGLSPDNFRTIVEKRDIYEHYFQELIRKGMDQGVFTAADVKILSYAILTLCTAGASWFDPQGRLNADEIAVIYETFILKGLKSPPPARLLHQKPETS